MLEYDLSTPTRAMTLYTKPCHKKVLQLHSLYLYAFYLYLFHTTLFTFTAVRGYLNLKTP
jgi:hypothetical protein